MPSDNITSVVRARGLDPMLPGEPTTPNVRKGACIRLRTLECREIDTYIKDLVMISYRGGPMRLCTPALLPKDVIAADVPVGTEVFLIEEGYGSGFKYGA